MKIKLTSGRSVEIEPQDLNPFGQVCLSNLVEKGYAKDKIEMCELLGADPSQIRYGMVHHPPPHLGT